ncbi:MAG: hypothetical protein LHV69_02570 [Elusimicrobia bacterium]|nr:hypothetical protein [Candidatus Obscuribacterium magneticum]
MESKRSPWVPLAIDAKCGIALCRRGRGEFREAATEFGRITRIYKNINDNDGFAYALWAYGTTQRFIGYVRKAEISLRKSLRLYEKGPDKRGSAYVMCGLAGTLRMKGWAKESGQLYRKAHATFKRINDRFGLAYSYCGMGNAVRMEGNMNLALKLLNKSIKLYKKMGQKGPLGFVYWSRAQARIYLKQFMEAREDLKRARHLFHAARDVRGMVYGDLGWGEYYRCLGDPHHRIDYARALREARSLGLNLEMLLAKRALGHKVGWSRFKKLGVDINRFSRYKTIP